MIGLNILFMMKEKKVPNMTQFLKDDGNTKVKLRATF